MLLMDTNICKYIYTHMRLEISSSEEIPHICCLALSHVQGQSRSPSKTEGGAKSPLESNPIPARDAQRAQTNFVCTRIQRPHRD